jgi:hypothetical protein
MLDGMMTTAKLTNADAVVLDYLSELWSHSEDLSPRLRDDLMATVARYITAHRGVSGSSADVVKWLGPPATLVEAIRRGSVPRPRR